MLLLQAQRLPNDLNIRVSDRVSSGLVFLFLSLSLCSWWWPMLFPLVGGCVVLLLVLNARLYRFVRDKRGLWFALQSIPWHWLYYWYSGLAFVFGYVRHVVSCLARRRSRDKGQLGPKIKHNQICAKTVKQTDV